jgi:hypothetical protein
MAQSPSGADSMDGPFSDLATPDAGKRLAAVLACGKYRRIQLSRTEGTPARMQLCQSMFDLP